VNGDRTAVAPDRPRVRGSARNGARDGNDRQYDLLTAAMVGMVVGAGAALLLRRGPSGNRPIGPAWRYARKGAAMAGRGARAAWDMGVDAWDRVPREEIAEHVRDYAENARDTIDEFVHSELKDLRRAIRNRRKKMGI
jgi:gas vesicle protein